MGTSRVSIVASPMSTRVDIRARFYPARRKPRFSKARPRLIKVPTVQEDLADRSRQRCPLVEGVMEDKKVQPFIHDCQVAVQEGDKTHNYSVFFKRHVRLPPNAAIQGLTGVVPITRSDLVVMKIGVKGFVINIGNRDTVIIDWMIKKLSTRTFFQSSRYIPAKPIVFKLRKAAGHALRN